MATNITYNGTSIQTATYVVSEIQHESLDNKYLNLQLLGRDDGGKVVSEVYRPKLIRIKGTVHGDTRNELETNIDALKQLINQQEKDLDIEYRNGWRRYKTYLSEIVFDRKYYNITFANYEAEFVVARPPFGLAIDTRTIDQVINTITTSTIVGIYCFEGTRRPLPIIQMTVNAEVNFSKVSFRNTTTGDAIVVEYDFNAADILQIDCENYEVTVNGIGVDYDGVFPEFAQSCNNFSIGVWANSCNITIQFIYRPMYL